MFTVEWNSQIDSYVTELDMAVEQGVMLGAQQIVQLARGYVRKDTTSLMDTIDAELEVDQPGIHEWSVNAGNVEGGYKGGGAYQTSRPAGAPVDYAIDQEYGGGAVPFTPYMTPASEDGWPLLQQAIIGQIESISG